MAQQPKDGVHLEEFLYRGRPPESDDPPTWHVILGHVAEDAFGKRTLALSGALTPEQAKEHGFDLPDILDAINADTLAEATALREKHERIKSEHADAQDKLVATEDQLAKARDQISRLEQQILRLHAEMKAPGPGAK